MNPKRNSKKQPPTTEYQLPNTGSPLPDSLQSGIEHLSGMDVSDIRVHYNSPKPARLHAHAYAQGNSIYLGPGQERHLPHEAWHVVQQKQGRVQPTKQLKGNIYINDDTALETEADMMAGKLCNLQRNRNEAEHGNGHRLTKVSLIDTERAVIQMRLYYGRPSRPIYIDRLLKNQFKEKALAQGSTEWPILIDLAFENAHVDMLIKVVGSPTGRRGWTIKAIEEIIPTPRRPGKGNMSFRRASTKLGFEIVGRPGWDPAITKRIHTKQGTENIRHIIPYHLLRDALHEWVNTVINKRGREGVLNDFRGVVIAGLDSKRDVPSNISEMMMDLLYGLNNIPANLWAGDAVENQRLNTVRTQIEKVRKDFDAKTITIKGIRQRLAPQPRKTKIHREILNGALQILQDAKKMDVIQNRLHLIALSCEIDIYPSQQEMGRLNMDIFNRNIPTIMSVSNALITNPKDSFYKAISVLKKLSSPHKDLKERESKLKRKRIRVGKEPNKKKLKPESSIPKSIVNQSLIEAIYKREKGALDRNIRRNIKREKGLVTDSSPSLYKSYKKFEGVGPSAPRTLITEDPPPDNYLVTGGGVLNDIQIANSHTLHNIRDWINAGFSGVINLNTNHVALVLTGNNNLDSKGITINGLPRNGTHVTLRRAFISQENEVFRGFAVVIRQRNGVWNMQFTWTSRGVNPASDNMVEAKENRRKIVNRVLRDVHLFQKEEKKRRKLKMD